MRIVLIDDHALFRSGLALILRSGFPAAVIDEYASIEAVLAEGGAISGGGDVEPEPGIVLLDNALESVAGIGAIRNAWPTAPIIMVSANDSGELASKAPLAGADGFVAKSEAPAAVISTIRRAMGTRDDDTDGATSAQSARSPRQQEIFALLEQGL